MKQKFRLTLLVLIPAALLLLTSCGATQTQIPKPATTSTTSPLFLDTDLNVTIPDKALINNYLTVSLETQPGTICKLTFVPPSGVTSEMKTTADSNGHCEWRWKLEEADGRGHGRLIFTVNGVSDTHFIDIRPGF